MSTQSSIGLKTLELEAATTTRQSIPDFINTIPKEILVWLLLTDVVSSDGWWSRATRRTAVSCVHADVLCFSDCMAAAPSSLPTIPRTHIRPIDLISCTVASVKGGVSDRLTRAACHTGVLLLMLLLLLLPAGAQCHGDEMRRGCACVNERCLATRARAAVCRCSLGENGQMKGLELCIFIACSVSSIELDWRTSAAGRPARRSAD